MSRTARLESSFFSRGLPDDRNVALVVAGAGIRHGVTRVAVQTEQIAPTILHLLGLNPRDLQAVCIDVIQVLPHR